MPVRKPRLLRQERGQIALAFVALLGLIVILTPPLMNLGEVARLKTRTAIAADSGALTGASYGSSAANHGARRAQTMVWIWWIVQTIYFVPFCLAAIPMAVDLWVAADLTISAMLAWTNSYMVTLFIAGRAATMAMALRNSPIDDKTGAVSTDIQNMFTALDNGPNARPSDPLPTYRSPDWIREGIMDEPSWLQVDTTYPPDTQVPQVTAGGARLTFWWWLPSCIFFVCFPAFGWMATWPGWAALLGNIAPTAATLHSVANSMGQSGMGGLQWVQMFTPIWTGISTSFRFPGLCGYLTIIPIFIPTNVRRPNAISNSTGNVTVRVQHHREAGALVAWWTMRYPDSISSATARYTGASVRLNPFSGPGDRSTAELVAIQ